MMKIAKEHLPRLFAALAKQIDLLLPAQQAEVVNFAPFCPDAEIDLTTLKTANTPKHFFLPQVEDLYTAAVNAGQISISAADTPIKPFAIFGVRACDAAALDVLDSVYLSDPIDQFYQTRRQAGCIITLACEKPTASCFCTAFGINPTEPCGDITTWLTDDVLYWQPNTEKGDKITELVADLLQLTDESPAQDISENICLPLDKFNPDNLLALFNAQNWQDLSVACIACGACTFVCPTCQCYDITDFDTGTSITRYRCWDSCLYSDFTQMAHGNPRTTQAERFRQRFMHKLVYHPANNDQYGCVGCGRCVAACPAGLNIVKVIKKLEVAGNV